MSDIVINQAEESDLQEVLSLAECYAAGNEWLEIDVEQTKKNVNDMFQRGYVFLGQWENKTIGGVAGYLLPCFYNNDIFFCTGFLFIKKEYRFLTRKFIKAVEKFLRATTANKLFFGITAGKNLEKRKRFFRILGYRELEVHMVKDLMK